MSSRFLTLSLLLCSLPTGLPLSAQESPQDWMAQGRATVERNLALSGEQNSPRAKNVILFIGDGMSIGTVTAARILGGQLLGMSGEEHELFFETFPNLGFAKTYNVNQQTPDSAGTMTAMVTGVKTDAGLISVNHYVVRGDCSSMQGNTLNTILQQAEQRGMSTGIVTTTSLTHATPAANYAHAMDRDLENDSDAAVMPNAGNCPDIARQLVEFTRNNPGSDGLEVALGGGRSHFLPKSGSVDPETGASGARLDGRDLLAEWRVANPKGAQVWNSQTLSALDLNKVPQLFGVFNPGHMQYEVDRANDIAGEPSLSEMTAAAIQVLQNNPRGYYLNVEAGRIDHAHHLGNAHRALIDTIELANAVRTAYEMTDPAETLIIVTADHGHTMTFAGYPTRGNPILGKVISNDRFGEPGATPALAVDGKPYTTLGYANGPGFHLLEDSPSADAVYALGVNQSGRTDLSAVDTTAPGYHSEVLVPLTDETHSSEDVAVYATGPGAELVRGVMEQNVIYHIMHEALQLDSR